MAILHAARLTPTKLELVAGWAPTQPWFPGPADAELVSVAAFRFDDPAGEVGLETLLVAADGVVLQVPVTYRDAPLAGAEASLIGTTQHSVLGERWVYDAVGDPVYLAAVAAAIATGGHEADLQVLVDGELVRREPTARVVGSGTGDAARAPSVPSAAGAIGVRQDEGVTVADAGDVSVVVVRTPATHAPTGPALGELTGTWTGRSEPCALVRLLAR